MKREGNCLICKCVPGYCLERVYREARERCIAKGEGWRWGIGSKTA